MDYRLLVFDFDGTLADTFDDIVICVNRALAQEGIQEQSRDFILDQVGMGSSNLISRVVGNGNAQTKERVFRTYTELSKTYDYPNTKLYPQVKEVIEQIDPTILKLVVSNKNSDSVIAMLKRFGMAFCFDLIIGAQHQIRLKPDPATLVRLLNEMMIDPQECLVIGDMVYDIQYGKGAGAQTCAALYGAGKREDLIAAAPDRVLTEFTDILRIIE